MAIVCVVTISLGMAYERAVATLGLPKSTGSEVIASEKASCPTDGSAKVAAGEVQKFKIGETLPMVPTRLVKCILSGEYVDMGELSQEALWAEFRRVTEGEDYKLSKSKFLRQITDRDAWAASFAQYAGVVCRSHLEKVVALWGHLAVVMSCQNRTTSGWWKTYDELPRHSYSSMKEATFTLYKCLFTQAMVESSESMQRPTFTVPTLPVPPRPKKRRAQACFPRNDSRPCASTPCQFLHCYARCGGDHARRFCPP